MKAALFLVFAGGVAALNNGLALTPPMGFNPWNCCGETSEGTKKLPSGRLGYNQTFIQNIGSIIASSPLKDAGYEYVNLDCGYSTGFRDASGHIIVNTTTFPDLKGLADYLHSHGLKFGIYSSASPAQCCSHIHPGANDGSYRHEALDAEWFASIGVDYLKYDECKAIESSYTTMRNALNSTGRPIVYTVHGPKGEGAIALANTWRTTGDITNSFSSILSRARENNKLAQWAGPGHWNQADMLEVGNYPLTDAESRTHFSLWCLMKSPLLIGHDLTNTSERTVAAMSILGNTDAIAINQDPLGVQGIMVQDAPDFQTWAGPLSSGDFTAALVNLAKTNGAQMTLTLTMADLTMSAPNATLADVYSVQDLWLHEPVAQKLSASTNVTVEVAYHDVAFLRLTPA